MTPAPSMPMPATTLSVMAPPRGDCSDTTPSDVGQKNALPKLYTVAARTIIAALVGLRQQHNPATATSAEMASRPSGENRCTSGPGEQSQHQHDGHGVDQHPARVDTEIGHRRREDRRDPAIGAELGDRERNHHEDHHDEQRLARRTRPQAVTDGQRRDEPPLDPSLDRPNTRATSNTMSPATTKALTKPASASISRYDTPAATRSLCGNCARQQHHDVRDHRDEDQRHLVAPAHAGGEHHGEDAAEHEARGPAGMQAVQPGGLVVAEFAAISGLMPASTAPLPRDSTNVPQYSDQYPSACRMRTRPRR